MGRKVHPKIFRTGVIYSWASKWFANKNDYAKLLREDIRVKSFLAKKLKDSSVDRFEIERTPRAITVTIHTAKPGVIIGRGGTGVEDLKKELREMMGQKKDSKLNLNVNIVEVTNPSLSANIIGQSVVADIEKRMPFRRVLKQHMDRIQKAGGLGAKIIIAGRLNGAEIARTEKVAWGKVPLQNLRADIDFASVTARTIFGAIGVKVWIYRGDVFGGELPVIRAPKPEFPRGGRGDRKGGRPSSGRGDRKGSERPASRGGDTRGASRPAARPAAARPTAGASKAKTA